MNDIPQNIKQQFFSLMNQLSPENLFCDGECTRAQAMARQRAIMREWAALERRVGRKVTQDEVEQEQISRWRNGSMTGRKLASELLFLAKELVGIEFPTQDAMDKYLKDHPDANRSKHRVKKDPKDETPDEVEERLKKKQGPAYRTQEQRLQDEMARWEKTKT